MTAIIAENLEQNFTQLRLLKSNFMDRLMKRGGNKRDHIDYKNIKFWLLFDLLEIRIQTR